MSLEAFLALLTVVALVSILFGLDRTLRPDTSHIERRLRRYGGRAFQLTEAEAKQAASSQVAQMVAQRVEASLSQRSFAGSLQSDLKRANLTLRVGEFLLLQCVSVLLVAVLAWLISGQIIVGIVFGFAGWFLPKAWLARRQASRLKALNGQLADTIALMSNSLRSGLSLVQSMEMISREAEPPISEEFQRVVREIGLGIAPQQALEHMVERVKSDDLELMVTAILVQFEVGGNLSKILDSIANTIRERVKLKGEIKTMAAQGKTAGYMLAGMPVGIGGILMLIAPTFIGKLFTPGPWIVMPICAGLGVVFGLLIIRKIVDIDV